jgi:hypothetical protein
VTNKDFIDKWASGGLKYEDKLDEKHLHAMWISGNGWAMHFAARHVAVKAINNKRKTDGDLYLLETDRERVADECADHIVSQRDKFDPAQPFQNWAWTLAKNKARDIMRDSEDVLDHAERRLPLKVDKKTREVKEADGFIAAADKEVDDQWNRTFKRGDFSLVRGAVDVIRNDVKQRLAWGICNKPQNVHERRMARYCALYYVLREGGLDQRLANVTNKRRKDSIKKRVELAVITRIATIEGEDKDVIRQSLLRCRKAFIAEYREYVEWFEATCAPILRRLEVQYANLEARGMRVYFIRGEDVTVQVGDKHVLGKLLSGWTADEMEAGAVFTRAKEYAVPVRRLNATETTELDAALTRGWAALHGIGDRDMRQQGADVTAYEAGELRASYAATARELMN